MKIPATLSSGLWLFGGDVYAAAAGAGVIFLAGRALSVSEFGRFMAVLSFAHVLGIAADSGQGIFAGRRVALDQGQASRTLGQLLSWRGLLMAVFTLTLPLSAWLVFRDASLERLSAWLVPSILILGLTDLFGWIFKGAKKNGRYAALQLSVRTALLLGCAFTVWRHVGVIGLLSAHAAAAFLTVILIAALIPTAVPNLRPAALDSEFFRHTLRQILQTGLILFCSVAFTRIDLLLVHQWFGEIPAGLYGAASRLVDGFRLLTTASIGLVLPWLIAASSAADFSARAGRAIAWSALAGGLAWAGGFFLGEPVLLLLMGPRYQAAAPLLIPLLYGVPFVFVGAQLFAVLYAQHDYWTPLVAILCAVVVEVVLIRYGVPADGATRAGWARSAGEMVNGLILGWGVFRARKSDWPFHSGGR